MVTKTKRTRSDSVSSAVKAMSNAALPLLQPPKHVKITPNAKPYWEGVILSRARDEWTEVDLVVAAQLAQCQADMADEDQELRKQGRVTENQRGTPIMNPLTTVMEQLARREMALMRALRIGGRVAGDPRDQDGKRKLEKESRKVRGDIAQENQDEEDLLPT